MFEISHLRTHGLSIFSISADANCFAAAPRKCKQTKLANCHPRGFAYFQTNYFNLIECRFLRWVQSGPVPHQCFGIIHKSQRHVKLMDQRIHKECAKLNKVRQKVKLVNWLEILLLLFNGSLFTNLGIREAFWIQLMSKPNLFWPNGFNTPWINCRGRTRPWLILLKVTFLQDHDFVVNSWNWIEA